MKTDNSRIKRIAVCGMLIALAFVLSYVESLFPPFFALPGMKLGLSNVVVLFAIYRLDFKSALFINFVRILLAGLSFGSAISFAFSIAGGMLSCIVMMILVYGTKFSCVSVSIVGGIMHNIGQIIVAVFLLNTYSVVWYFLALWFSGIATGAVVGFLSAFVIKRCLSW